MSVTKDILYQFTSLRGAAISKLKNRIYPNILLFPTAGKVINEFSKGNYFCKAPVIKRESGHCKIVLRHALK